MDRSTIGIGPCMDMPIMHDSDRYDFVRDIGSGNFGVARLMRDKQSKELVAVKYIERGDKVAATSDLMLADLMLAYVDFFLDGDEKRADLPPHLHQRFPMSLLFEGDGNYMANEVINSGNYLVFLGGQQTHFALAFEAPVGWIKEKEATTFNFLQVAATSDLMLAYVDFFLGGDEKRADLPPHLHQRFPMSLLFEGDGNYTANEVINSGNYLVFLGGRQTHFALAFEAPVGWIKEKEATTFNFLQVAATSDLMLAYVDFFLGGDEKRADLPPHLHQRFPMSLLFEGDGNYTANENYLVFLGGRQTHFALAFEAPVGWIKEKEATTFNFLQIIMRGGGSFSTGGLGKGMYSRFHSIIKLETPTNAYPYLHTQIHTS
ncbi:uncharacterized protein LOC130785051 isoform X3 [Actinidia eriantha]|uniref:uncharacterized protein LOC130785051 isoform X3 n=1 Tax=Actinidia eriantha TaxID=165200 RepID=UPI00258AACA1|nr:uncharacterized protein LOC130785051 isoform X3 [Actinidia eriantha]